MSTPPLSAAEEQSTPVTPRVSLRTVAAVFLRLGATSFGGPAAHIAIMEEEFVRRRQWITRADFLDLLGATNLIPGPNSTEMAIHIGRRMAGWPGLLVAGFCFICPAVLIVAGIAWMYMRHGTLPQVAAILYGVKPVVIAVIVLAGWRVGAACVTSWSRALLALAAVAAAAMALNELMILGLAGVLTLLGRRRMRASTSRDRTVAAFFPPLPLLAISGTAASGGPVGLGPLFWLFLKIGSVLFGSGYVLFAFLRSDLVEDRGWLTEQQLLDAIVVGQITPGPVFTTATFIGYVLGGPAGACVATVGIFLPAFVFVAISGPLIPRLRRSPSAGAFLDGVNVASVALLAVVAFHLGRASLIDLPAVGIALAAFVLIRWVRINPTWLILAGAAAGLLMG